MLKHLGAEHLSEIVNLADRILAKHKPDSLGLDWGQPRDPRRGDPDKKALREKIGNLTPAARMELMALMWIGREPDWAFDDALAYAYKNSNDGDVEYIAGKAMGLSIYLHKGLALIQGAPKRPQSSN